MPMNTFETNEPFIKNTLTGDEGKGLLPQKLAGMSLGRIIKMSHWEDVDFTVYTSGIIRENYFADKEKRYIP